MNSEFFQYEDPVDMRNEKIKYLKNMRKRIVVIAIKKNNK